MAVDRRTVLLGGGVAVAGLLAREYYLLASLKGPDPLTMLNAADGVVPFNKGVVKLADGTAYGPDPRQRVDVYRPDNGPALAPMVVFFYGGGWVKGTRQDHRFVGRALASAGFVAVVADYRLVPDVRYPVFVTDGAAAVAWAMANAGALGGDPARVSVVGHSAGSYIAAMLAVDRRFGVADKLDRWVGISGGRYVIDSAKRASLGAAFNGVAGDEPVAPIDFVRPGIAPALLLTGSVDDVAAPQLTYDFAAALRRNSNAVTVTTYDGVEHKDMLAAFAGPYRWTIPVLRDVAAFLHTRT